MHCYLGSKYGIMKIGIKKRLVIKIFLIARKNLLANCLFVIYSSSRFFCGIIYKCMNKTKMDIKRDFKGIWIPKEIWLTEELTLQEKIFLVEIDSLDNDDHCIANNTYFSKFFGISTKRVSLIITALKNKGFITEDSFDGRKRHLISNMEQKVKADENKGSNQPRTKVPSRVEGKFPHNNTTNNTVNNKPISIADKSANPVKVKIDFQSKLSSIAVSEDLKERIVGVYWQKKGITFRNNLTYDKALKRLKKTAGELIGYEGEDILGLMTQLQAQSHNVDWEWKLTTVVKKIDDFIAKKNRKNN